MPRLFGLISVWALAAFAVLVVLQLFPPTGIFLMMLGAGLFTALLVHVFLFALAGEALLGKIPRFLIAVPVIAYAGYYGVYISEGLDISRRVAALRAGNPGQVMAFDIARDTLVGERAERFVTGYALPVAYEKTAPDVPEGYRAYRLLPRSQCDIPRDTEARIQISWVSSRSGFGLPRLNRGVCVLRVPESPTGRIVTATEIESRSPDARIVDTTTDITVDGKIIGRFHSETVRRLPFLPMGFIGCGLISSAPAWKCAAEFLTTPLELDVIPPGIDKTLHDSPVSIMLGLREYREGELENFRGFARNDAAIRRVNGEKARVADSVFDAFRQMLDGKDVKPPWAMAYGLTRDPQRLEQLTPAMVVRLDGLSGAVEHDFQKRDEARVIALALTAVPDAVFAKVAARVQDIMRRTPRSWELYSALYIRSGDAGAAGMDFYKRDLFSKEVFPIQRDAPVLAICRVGRTDDETIAELKRLYLQGYMGDGGTQKSAVFATLLKLGQRDFLVQTTDLGYALFSKHAWEDALLAGQGSTAIGPNNCMPKEWDDVIGDAMKPRLKRGARGSWTAEP